MGEFLQRYTGKSQGAGSAKHKGSRATERGDTHGMRRGQLEVRAKQGKQPYRNRKKRPK